MTLVQRFGSVACGLNIFDYFFLYSHSNLIPHSGHCAREDSRTSFAFELASFISIA